MMGTGGFPVKEKNSRKRLAVPEKTTMRLECWGFETPWDQMVSEVGRRAGAGAT